MGQYDSGRKPGCAAGKPTTISVLLSDLPRYWGKEDHTDSSVALGFTWFLLTVNIKPNCHVIQVIHELVKCVCIVNPVLPLTVLLCILFTGVKAQ